MSAQESVMYMVLGILSVNATELIGMVDRQLQVTCHS
jgi:hypothetical protein